MCVVSTIIDSRVGISIFELCDELVPIEHRLSYFLKGYN